MAVWRAALVTVAAALLCGAAPGAGQFLRPLDASTPIGYAIADGRGGSGYRPSDRQLAVWAFDEWQRASGGRLTLRPVATGEAIVRLNWAEPADGQYGEMQEIVVGGRHGAAVFIRPDMNALGPEIAARANRDDLLRDTIVYMTSVHELGHAFGLPHTRGYDDIMYFFGYGGDIAAYFGRYRAKIRARSDIARTSALSPADVAAVRSLYGTR